MLANGDTHAKIANNHDIRHRHNYVGQHTITKMSTGYSRSQKWDFSVIQLQFM